MKQSTKTIILTLFFIGVVSNQTSASSGKATTTVIKNLDALVSISQDLYEETPVYIKVNSSDDMKSCFCVCRDNLWSCTQTECEKQNRECPEDD